MDLLLTVKLLHLLLLVYWLGADLGTFYASRFVADARLSPAQRATAAKIMLGIDIAPRVCMPLTLASGVHLAAGYRLLPLSPAAVAWVWLLCAAWLAGALAVHHVSGRGGAPMLARVDGAARIAVVLVLAAAALAPALLGSAPVQGWLAAKMLAFAGTVVCGLMIRRHLRPFGPAFATLTHGGGGDPLVLARANDTIAASIRRCVPWVLAIWVLLVAAAALGIHLIG